MSAAAEEHGTNPHRATPLGRLLIEQGLLTEEQLIEGLLEQGRTGDKLGKVLIRLGFVDAPSVAMALASQHGGPLKTEYGCATGFGPAAAADLATDQPEPPSPEPAPADPPVSAVADEPASAVADETASAAADETAPAESQRAPSRLAAMIAEAEAAQAELDAALTRIADLERELVTVREALEEERSKAAALEDTVAGLEDKVAGARFAAESAIAALRAVTEAPPSSGR